MRGLRLFVLRETQVYGQVKRKDLFTIHHSKTRLIQFANITAFAENYKRALVIRSCSRVAVSFIPATAELARVVFVNRTHAL